MLSYRIQPAARDVSRIHAQRREEIRDWAAEFGVSQQELRQAVRAVGFQARAVDRYLRSTPR